MPDRIVRATILTSASMAKLPWGAEVFYRRLFSVADDYGRFDARPAILRAALYPLQLERVREKDVEHWIDDTVKHGVLRFYTVDGSNYLEIQKFEQRIQGRPKFPAPSDGEALTVNHRDTPEKTATRTRSSPSPTSSEGESEGALPFPSPEFAAAWSDWLQHRREIKHAVTPTQRAGQLLRLGAMRERAAIAMIRHTISQGWRGLRELDAPGKGGNVIKFEKPMAGAVDSPRPVGNASPELYDKGAESMRLARESLRTGQPITPATP